MHPPIAKRTARDADPRPRRRLLGAAAILPLVAGALALAPSAASAATRHTWYVAPSGTATTCSSNSKTSPFGTIQAAVTCAADGSVIQLARSGSTPYPGVGRIGKNVTIEAAAGAGARTVQIEVSGPPGPDGETPGAITVAAGSSVKVRGVTIECPASGQCWGSLVTNNGTLSMSSVSVTGSQVSPAVTNRSTDSGSGPARLTITDSSIVHNTSLGFLSSGAGGITNLNSPDGAQSQLTVTDSTLADNTDAAGNHAGAIYTNASQHGAVQLNGDTIADNHGAVTGGIEDPIAPGGSLTPVELQNTIIAGNDAADANGGADCVGNLADLPGGHNLIGDDTGCGGLTNGLNDDLVTVPDPGLQSLADNGGQTDTVALQPQSPAIGAGEPATCSSTDQRGDSRKLGTRGCDVGAYDTQGVAPAAHAIWYVAPAGTTTACASNSKSTPFGTIQAALACASSGDVIQLARSRARPYPGVGTIGQNVTIKAAPGVDARTVRIDVSRPASGQEGYSPGVMTVSAGNSVRIQGVTIECPASATCWGPLVTNSGTLSMFGVSVTGSQDAPAIANRSADSGTGAARLAITDSSVSHNVDATDYGAGGAGGITNLPSQNGVQSQLTVTNSTIADDTATGYSDAGGISSTAIQDGSVQLSGDTITGDQGGLHAAGGVADPVGSAAVLTPIELRDTIVAGNTIAAPGNPTTASDCNGNFADLPGGHSLIGDAPSCGGLTNGTDGDQIGTPEGPIDPLLAPVALNGGGTATAPPLAGSPAIGAGDAGTCGSAPLFDLDQRGDSRNVSARKACDIGAYDTGGTVPTAVTPTIKLAATASPPPPESLQTPSRR